MTAQQLKNSILQMAVQGKLVPQDPNDEPASVLLERIRAEKERLIKEKKIKREKNPSVIFKGADNTPYEKIGDEVQSLADEVPFDIPRNWAWTRIGSLFTLQAGKNIPAADIYKKRFDNSFPCFGGNGVRGYVRKSNRCGDYPIIGRQGALCGNINRATGEFYATEHAVCVECYLDTNVPWACLFLDALNLNQYATATAQPGLAVATINEVLIPVPPIEEQLRIVKVYELLIPYIVAYKSTTEKLRGLNAAFSEALKKSILQEAVQGKLVPQDPSDEPAEALLERIRAEKQRLIKEGKIKKDKHESVIFRRDNSHYEKLDGMERCIDDELPFEIPESWAWVRWGAIAESIQYGYNAPAKQEGRIRMVRISDIHENTVAWSSVPFCDIDDSDIPTYLLQANDILFARTGGTVGKSFLVSEVPCESIYAGYLIRTRYSSLLCPQYLKYFMESPLYWQQLKSGTTATAQPNCNGQTLAKMLLPLPPANEQLRIVDNLARTFTIIEKM